jgi:hypothetical protein
MSRQSAALEAEQQQQRQQHVHSTYRLWVNGLISASLAVIVEKAS